MSHVPARSLETRSTFVRMLLFLSHLEGSPFLKCAWYACTRIKEWRWRWTACLHGRHFDLHGHCNYSSQQLKLSEMSGMSVIMMCGQWQLAHRVAVKVSQTMKIKQKSRQISAVALFSPLMLRNHTWMRSYPPECVPPTFVRSLFWDQVDSWWEWPACRLDDFDVHLEGTVMSE